MCVLSTRFRVGGLRRGNSGLWEVTFQSLQMLQGLAEAGSSEVAALFSLVQRHFDLNPVGFAHYVDMEHRETGPCALEEWLWLLPADDAFVFCRHWGESRSSKSPSMVAGPVRGRSDYDGTTSIEYCRGGLLWYGCLSGVQ